MSRRAENETPRTTVAPVTTMEEIPVLTVEQRIALAASIAAAEARIEAGDFIEYDPDTFKARLLQS